MGPCQCQPRAAVRALGAGPGLDVEPHLSDVNKSQVLSGPQCLIHKRGQQEQLCLVGLGVAGRCEVQSPWPSCAVRSP